MPRHDSVGPILLLALALIGLGGAVAACGRGSREEADRTGERSASADDSGAKKKIDDAARGPNKSAEACAKCHEEQSRFWAYGAHSNLSCADCHGVERDHVETGMAPLVAGNAQVQGRDVSAEVLLRRLSLFGGFGLHDRASAVTGRRGALAEGRGGDRR